MKHHLECHYLILVFAYMLLYGEIVFGFHVLVVGRHRAVGDAPRAGHRLLCRSGLQYEPLLSRTCLPKMSCLPKMTCLPKMDRTLSITFLFCFSFLFFLYFYSIFYFHLLVTRVRPHFRCRLSLIINHNNLLICSTTHVCSIMLVVFCTPPSF